MILSRTLIGFSLFFFSLCESYSLAIAATPSKHIAVIDIHLNAPLATVDDLGQKIVGTLTVFENHKTPLTASGDLNLALIRTSPVALSQRIELERHGSSSLGHLKKNYALDLKGNASPLLGMGADKEWILHSCWADKTCLRNSIGYWQANKLFKGGSPRTEFAEIFINDEYRGLYVVTEKIKLSPSRVNLPEVDNNDITGTYIFKREATDSGWDWASTVDYTTYWWLVAPKRKNIAPAQLQYISNFMNTVVEPQFSPTSPSYNPAHYASVVDQAAAIKFMIMQELSNGVDAYWKSMFITKKRDNKIYMGPVWDMDLSFANANISPETCQSNGWRIETSEASGRRPFQPLREMWNIPSFRKAFKKHWFDLRNRKIIAPEVIGDQLAITYKRIRLARIRDDKKWHTIGQAVWWECSVQPTYAGEVVELNRWIRTRIDWMDKEMMGL